MKSFLLLEVEVLELLMLGDLDDPCGGCAERLTRGAVVAFELRRFAAPVVLNCLWPSFLKKNFPSRRFGHARVDERAAAKAVRDEDADVFADSQIVQAVLRSTGDRVIESAETHMPG